jgi:hypothetical protein
MLKFDPDFVADQDNLACVLYADAPSGERVCFIIDRLILQDVLDGGNPAHDDANDPRGGLRLFHPHKSFCLRCGGNVRTFGASM